MFSHPPADPAFDALVSVATQLRFEAGTELFKQGEAADSVLLIGSGHVKIVHGDTDGRQTVLGVRGPGDLIGEFAALTHTARNAGAVSLQQVTGYAVDSATFLHLLIRDPGTMLRVVTGIIAKVGEADRRRLEFGRMNVESRVARFLVEVAAPAWFEQADQAGSAAASVSPSMSAPVTIPLTQTDLATAVGATRESCAVAMRRLRGAGLVTTRHREITVLDLEQLRLLGDAGFVQPPGRDPASRPNR